MKKKFLAIIGAVGLLAAGAIAQTALPYVTTMSATDAIQVIPNGIAAVGNKYMTARQMQSYTFSSNSQHGSTAPALSSCGTSPAISGTDWAGTITLGTGTPTGCIATFNTAYTGVPYCTVTSQTAPGTTTPAYSVSATAITIVQAANSSNKYDYVCVGRQGG